MSIKFSEVVDNLTTKPLQDKDIWLFSNTTDGGTSFDVSKWGYVDEVKAFFGVLGAIPQDVVVTGTGTGAGASNLKGGDLFSDGDLYLAHENYFNGNSYALFQSGVDGEIQLNTPLGTSIFFTVNNNQIMIASSEGLRIEDNKNLVVGTTHSDPAAGAKAHVKGDGDTSATKSFTVSSNSGGTSYSFQVRDDQRVFLLNGTGVNEFSTDGSFASDSEDKVPVEKAVKAYVDTNIGAVSAGLFPKMPARVATTTYLDNVGVGVWTRSGSGAGKTLTAGSVGVLAIDGVNTVLGDRVWIKDEDGSSTNLDNVDHGIYEVTTEGTGGVAAILTRATDFDGSIALEVRSGSYADVLEGAQNTNTGWWVISEDPIVVDTDPILIALHRDPLAGSKIIFSDYIVGTTSNPTTSATTSGAAPVIAEMTKTFTPSSSSNKVKVEFSGSFSNNKDENARCGVFIDGVLQAETERRQYVSSGGGDFNGHLFTQWQGLLSVASHTITIRMWTTGNTLTAIETQRNLIITETRE